MKVDFPGNPWVAPVLRPPDLPEVRLQNPLTPAGILESLFLKWEPLGKNRAQPEVAPQEVRGWLKEMLIAFPTQGSARSFVLDAEDFGWRILALMARFEIKVEILRHSVYLLRRRLNTRGMYSTIHKTVSLDEAYLDGPGESTVHHEMAHALDHLISSLCLRGQCCSTMLWHGFASQRQAFVTPAAGKDPREYFAESVGAYFQTSQRSRLRQHDPGMHAFMQALFELSNL